MKIDRLIGILSILIQKQKVTAPELAQKFEVSRRTINRDIESLCQAGIPICTSQGNGGGIEILDGYKMDRTVLTSKEMQMIIAGLRSLDSVSGSNFYGRLMEKIKTGSSDFLSGNESILIDLSAWNRESLSPKIEVIQDAMEKHRAIGFEYFSPAGETKRKMDPFYLVFKWHSWYVWGWCRLRKEFRLFKLSRMINLKMTKLETKVRKVQLPDFSSMEKDREPFHLAVEFDSSMKYQLIEEYGPESFKVLKNGRLLFERNLRDREYAVNWILSCREKARVLEPQMIIDELKKTAMVLSKNYGDGRRK